MTQAITTAAREAGKAALREAPRYAASLAADQAAKAASNLLFGPVKRITTGRALDEIRLLTAGEGRGIPRVYGRGRIGGQVIWASDPVEETQTVTSAQGGKGVQTATETTATEYRYKISLAIALCEGELARIGRVWADGKLITLADYQYRIHRGTEDQLPDALLEAELGGAPAFKGLAYIVFEDLPLAPFGNRVPQFNFEVICPVDGGDDKRMEKAIRAVTIIPGSGEAVLSGETVMEDRGDGVTRPLNRHNGIGVSDAEASFDEMIDVLPNLEAASLVVSWFGTDLRAGHCEVLPGVELADRMTEPEDWTVAGYTRTTARLLSQTDGRPSYGGTPSDAGVLATIADLKARGLAVAFHPFVLMDVPSGNGLPDPYGGAEQASFPWRGRITANILSDDGTSSVDAQVDHFFDSYEPMVLHYAQLCAQAGGVDTFIIGSELRGLTRLRNAAGGFPAVARLQRIAAAVRVILPQVTITYGADWSEYGAYQPGGSNDLFYPLDPLWADGNIDAVGIDNYFPLTDWRDGSGHADGLSHAGPYDQDYIAGRIRSGEGYDWYYASDADRLAQLRTPIVDSAYGEDWVFRPKDIWSWWSEDHHPRSGGIKGAKTGWVPQSKPVLFTEIGCGAVDKGPNQPNVFVDPKSAESALPHFSSGVRDDRAQRAFLEAQHRFWSDPANNPVSPLTQKPMVEAGRMYVYAWDARPFPDFPARSDVWADAENWTTGHWLNGRAGRVPLGALVETLAADAGLPACDASACDMLVSGLTIPGPATGREAIEPLLDLFQLDAFARDGLLIVKPRTGSEDMAMEEGDLLDLGELPLSIERAQDEEIPAALSITYADELSGYALKTTEVRDETVVNGRTLRMGTSVVLEQGEAAARARAILAEARAMRERAAFALPEVADGIEPGSVLTIATGASALRLRITVLEEGPFRSFEAVTTDPGCFEVAYEGLRADPESPPISHGAVVFEAMDLPMLPTGSDQAHLWLAAFAEPWPGTVSVHDGSGGYLTGLTSQSFIGTLASSLEGGATGRWDRGSRFRVQLPAGGLSSLPEADVLGGAHLCAVETGAGWEVLQYRSAVLQPDGTWELSDLLRGRFGTDAEAAIGAAAGARIVFLEGAKPVPLPADQWGGSVTFEAGPATVLPGAYPYRSRSFALEGSGARPLAPVHLRATTSGAQITLDWIRRTRVGGDQFGSGDVPLGETVESYEVRLYDAQGGELARHVVDQTSFSFTEPGAVSASVAQLSSAFGAGRSASVGL
ncbi:baseplate multidomain protein megatron [Parvularcula lutaonensis]|uniref:Glycoside hydrolase/phage tail family protein n=1 Tax=Parvularcula lutaonensis TaxID=491923 RepID=A0ABV7MDI4_9PROT|nr:glycoside hydrolase/phage tail family protein [Parvularcula lutaonensis]GGY53258.1 hypothetical protein GCM10007148_23120 [Parvularcula lutaonensis]